MSLHFELAERIGQHFADHLAAPPELRQDAILVTLANGSRVEIRYAAVDAYSLRWGRGETQQCIDTAPCHPELATSPNHLHRADGSLEADPFTRIGAPPWDNVRVVLELAIAGR
ncbi:MAG: hypothetical protein KDH15_15285 [Rhodocyclaceae bacterium]|nr:hypothetical protein [Rhodocyclaceae bacterium]